MMTSILQYSLEFANLFWNHPTFSATKKSNFVVDCLDSFRMTASMSLILQTACCDLQTYPHGIQNNWMKHFSPGNFLLHAACLQQHILTWTGLHTHHCSESSGLMDGEVFHKRFQTSCVQIVELLMVMFVIFRQKCYGTLSNCPISSLEFNANRVHFNSQFICWIR